MPTLRHCIRCGEHIVVGDRFCAHCGTEQPATLGGDTSEKGSSRWDEIEKRLQEATEGRYHIRGLIGRGGMAAVYLADWPNMELRIAIKVMDPFLLDQETFVQRFLQEARTIAKLRHRHIIRVYDSGQAGDLFYFCMDYYPGRSMEKVLQAETQIPVQVVKIWLSQAADALGYAHRQPSPVVHRDVKPSNMLLDSEGEVVLTDFGIAKVRDMNQTMRSPALTMPGAVLGTPSYISPEQASIILDSENAPAGGQATSASDQYSLGVVGFEMLCGEPPFSGDLAGLCVAHAEREPPEILERRPDCPPELASTIQRMMAKRPEDRWPTMEAACAALAAQVPSAGSSLRTQMASLAIGHKPVGSISLTPPSGEFFVGQSFRVTGTPLDLDGHPLLDRPLSWKSSDPHVAEVTPDGMVRAIQPGPVSITATVEGISGQLQLAVAPVRVDTVVVLPSELTLQEGEAQTARTLLLSRDGEDLSEREVVWTSNDPSVASVEGTGRIVALQAGTTIVMASSEGRSGQARVSVVPVPVTFVEVSPNPATVEVGGEVFLTCVPRDPKGNALEDRAVTWTVDDPSVVEVLPDGSLRGGAPGRAVVSAVVEGVVGTVEVTVPPEQATSVAVSPEAAEVEEEAKLQLTAVISSASGRKLTGYPVEWWSDAPDVAGVDAMGRVTGLRTGVAQITAACGEASASAEVSVTPAPVAEIEPLQEAVELEVGDVHTLGSVLRSRGGRVLEGREVGWQSTAPEIAQVDSDGRIKATAEGSAEILLASEGLRVSVGVTVVPPRVVAVETSPTFLELMEEDTAQVGAMPMAKDGRPVEGRRMEWSSSDPSVASVGSEGRITATAPGETTITVKCEGHSASVTVRVTPIPVASVVIDGPQENLLVGDRAEFRARTLDASGRDLGRDLRWVSSDDTVLEVDSHGWVETVGTGTAEILATSEGVYARVWVEVQPVPIVVPEPEGEPAHPERDVVPPIDESVPEAVEEPELAPEEPWVPEPVAESAVAGNKEERPKATAAAGPHRSPLRFLLWALPVAAVAVGGGLWMTRDTGEPSSPPTPVASDVGVTTASGLAVDPILQVVAGDTLGLVASATTEDGTSIPEPEVTWASSDPGLATVDARGTLVARATGSLTVSATIDAIIREVPVEITAPAADPTETPEASQETQPRTEQTDVQPTEARRQETVRTPTPQPDSARTPEPRTPPPEAAPPPPDGHLVLRVFPRGARVEIDGELKGENLRLLPLSLPPGSHRLRLEIPGFVPVDTVISIVSGDTLNLRQNLRRIG